LIPGWGKGTTRGHHGAGALPAVRRAATPRPTTWTLRPVPEGGVRSPRQTDHWPVHQHGPRRLWNEIETAYHAWYQAGRPPVEQWRLTITAHGQHLGFTPGDMTWLQRPGPGPR
jgi:hypothetical protein